jgi:hypothetical protein
LNGSGEYDRLSVEVTGGACWVYLKNELDADASGPVPPPIAAKRGFTGSSNVEESIDWLYPYIGTRVTLGLSDR